MHQSMNLSQNLTKSIFTFPTKYLNSWLLVPISTILQFPYGRRLEFFFGYSSFWDYPLSSRSSEQSLYRIETLLQSLCKLRGAGNFRRPES